MSTFTEEQLDSPAGYYAGQLGQKLQNGRWEIIRKLGWGSLSSTWLAVDSKDPDNIEAVKIFTVSATQDSSATNERNILQRIADKNIVDGVPVLRGHFYEESPKGKHLCLVLHVLGTSIDSFRSSNKLGKYLPLHAVKKIAADVLEVLDTLHGHKITHGAVTPDNLLFSSLQQGSDIRQYISEHPSVSAEQITGSNGSVYPIVHSQPIMEDIKWDASATDFANESIYLSNFANANIGSIHGVSRALRDAAVPEALRGESVGSKADIWMLGYTTYLLLTGSAPFAPTLNAESLQGQLTELVSGIEQKLCSVTTLSAMDLSETASFITLCLTLHPEGRPSADKLLEHAWVLGGTICSCGWCSSNV